MVLVGAAAGCSWNFEGASHGLPPKWRSFSTNERAAFLIVPAGSGQPTTGSIEIQKSGVHRRPAPAATNANPNPPLPGANPMTKNSLIGFRAGGGGIPSPQGQVRLPLNPHTQHTERTYRPNPGRFPHCRSSQSMSYSVCPGNASTRTPAATAAVSTATSRWAPGRPPKAWGGTIQLVPTTLPKPVKPLLFRKTSQVTTLVGGVGHSRMQKKLKHKHARNVQKILSCLRRHITLVLFFCQTSLQGGGCLAKKKYRKSL